MGDHDKRKVVLVFEDGSRAKGLVKGFRPDRSRVVLEEVDRGGRIVQLHDVDLRQVMAAFFVRDLAIWRDEPLPDEGAAAPAGPRGSERRVRVRFVWGETMDAWVERSDPRRRWVHLRPRDTSARAANVEGVYATRRAVAWIRPVKDAD